MTNGAAGTAGIAGTAGTLGSYMPLASLSSGLGQVTGGLLAGSYEDAIRRAQDYYRGGMERAGGELRRHEEIGREDIQRGLEGAQQYGAPYRGAGETALQSYMGSLGLGGAGARQSALEAFQASPGYQFALEEGLKGVQRGLAPRGLAGSGREAKELSRYATGLAGQEYGGWQQQLADLATGGRASAEQAAQRQYQTGGQLAELGVGYGGSLADLYERLSQSQAESQLAQAQAAQQRGQAFGQFGIGSAILGKLGGFY